MIFKEDTYCLCYHKLVREIGVMQAVVFSTIAGLLRDDGIGEIANDTICSLVGISERYLRPIVKKLIDDGYLEKKQGDGRGNKCIYYLTKKGEQNVPFYGQKRGNKMYIKGEQNVPKRGNKVYPINKDNNKEINKEEGEYAREAHTSPSHTPLIEDNLFLYFWSIYPEAESYPHEQEECYKYWQLKSEIEKDTIIAGIEQKKFNSLKNPIFFLKDFRLTRPNKNTKVRSAIVDRFIDVIVADTNEDICQAIANITVHNDTMYINIYGDSFESALPIINQIEERMLENEQRVREFMERNNSHKIEYGLKKPCE